MQISKLFLLKKGQKTIFALITTALLMIAVNDGLCCFVTDATGATVQGRCQGLTTPKVFGRGGKAMPGWECCPTDIKAPCDRLEDTDSKECDKPKQIKR